jgi:hypothetical protein
VHLLIAAEAERHHGIVASHHFAELGVTDAQRAWLVRSGALIRERYGSYRVAGVPPSWKGDLLTAVWAGGTRARASHRSAAAIWDVPGGARRMQEVMCRQWRRARHEGLVVHETKLLDDFDVAVVDGIPVTSIERTILDLGAVRSPDVVERAMEAALRRELTTIDRLWGLLGRVGRRGRNGSGVLRSILDARCPEQKLTDSTPEVMMMQIFRRRGLPAPVPQFEIWHQGHLVARVDGALPQWRIAFEYESYQEHTGKTALVRNSRRRNELLRIDWVPIAVTWPDLVSGGLVVCAQVRDVIALRSAA